MDALAAVRYTRARRLEYARYWIALATEARLAGLRDLAAQHLEYAGNWRRLTAEGLAGPLRRSW